MLDILIFPKKHQNYMNDIYVIIDLNIQNDIMKDFSLDLKIIFKLKFDYC